MDALLHFSGGEGEQAHAIANVENLLEDDSTTVESVVFVANGDGVYLLTEDETTKRDEIVALVEKGVSFRACRNSLGLRDLTPEDVLEGVETVPAGVGELVKREDEGYNYVKTP
ncbi:DsrE family protein [Halorussus halophilus]|uniref:DsrE family protein n=1 Tax=Halorussus halophilus TaxID=2650975 RepID=UPI001300F4B5|nr:DsrE family protein [Halorussus halophilus]